jgi:hypothetical protein
MTWSTADALTYAHHLLDCPIDPDKSGTTRLAEAFIALHAETVRLRLEESDRLILQTLAWDRQAGETWPHACDVIQKWIERNGL